MASVAAKVLSTVRAPYAVLVTASLRAEKIANIKSAAVYDCNVFAVLSELPPKIQQCFINERGVSKDLVVEVARNVSVPAKVRLPPAVRMKNPPQSRGPEHFDMAMAIIVQSKPQGAGMNSRSFGGGTALMPQINHRERHDIDLFIEDAQSRMFRVSPT